MTVYINGNALPVQPTTLTEQLLQMQTDQESINGSMSRNRINQKKNSQMDFTIMSPADYQTTLAYFTTGSGVYYLNDKSNYVGGILSMSGLPTFTEGAYVAGASLFRPFSVTIREI